MSGAACKKSILSLCIISNIIKKSSATKTIKKENTKAQHITEKLKTHLWAQIRFLKRFVMMFRNNFKACACLSASVSENTLQINLLLTNSSGFVGKSCSRKLECKNKHCEVAQKQLKKRTDSK